MTTWLAVRHLSAEQLTDVLHGHAMHQGRERHHALVALSKSQGIETGKRHHNAGTPDTSGYYATAEPFSEFLNALHEQGWPGELARARALAAAADTQRRLEAALAGRSEADVLAAFASLPDDEE